MNNLIVLYYTPTFYTAERCQCVLTLCVGVGRWEGGAVCSCLSCLLKCLCFWVCTPMLPHRLNQCVRSQPSGKPLSSASATSARDGTDNPGPINRGQQPRSRYLDLWKPCAVNASYIWARPVSVTYIPVWRWSTLWGAGTRGSHAGGRVWWGGWSWATRGREHTGGRESGGEGKVKGVREATIMHERSELLSVRVGGCQLLRRQCSLLSDWYVSP